jgi:alpha-beta hydrolase superfamily lysophospholipase
MFSMTRYARLLAALAVLAGCAGRPMPPLPGGVPPTETDGSFVMPDGARLPYRIWLPGGDPWAVVLALHGFDDSRDAWEIPAPSFTRDGIAIVAPDQRGFGAAPGRGRWPGEAVLLRDAADMLRQVHARYPTARLYAMGESMGGAELMRLATEAGAPRLAGIILIAPAVWSRKQMNVFMRSGLWLASRLVPGLAVTGGEVPVRVRASDNRAALIRLSQDPLTLHATRFDMLRGLVDLMDDAQASAPDLPANVLLLYGGQDQLVPPEAMAATWCALPPGPVLGFYPNGYHLLLRDLDRAQPTGDVIAWMHDPTAALPSGADRRARDWLHAQVAAGRCPDAPPRQAGSA